MKLKLILKAIKTPHKIPRYIKKVIEQQKAKRKGYTYAVVEDTDTMAQFCSRIYHETRLLEETLKDCEVDQSLEIGCGYGRLTPWIAEHSDKHYAIEPDKKRLNEAAKAYPDISFYNSTAQKLPFEDGKFDLIVTWTVLQHIPPSDFPKAVSEIKRVASDKAMILTAEKTKGEEGYNFWSRSVEEWEKFFSPYKLKYSTKRELEKTHQKHGGKVMLWKKKTK